MQNRRNERKREVKQPSAGRGARRPRRRGRRSQQVQGLDFKSLNPSNSAPVARSRNMKTAKPGLQSLKNGDMRVRHREYVTDVVAGTGDTKSIYNVQAFAINPGQLETFQWLSKIASNFESYSFNSLRFFFSTESPSSMGGTVLLAIDYDALDAVPATKQQAMTYRSTVRCSPWGECVHTSMPADLHKLKSNYVRSGVQPAGSDIKTYDIGNLFAITQAITTPEASLGELWVEYDVVLMTPTYTGQTPVIVSGGEIEGKGDMEPGNPFGNSGDQLQPLAYGIEIDDASNITFLAPGEYIIASEFGGTGLTDGDLAPSGANVVIGVWNSGYVNDAETFMTCLFLVTVSGEPGYVTHIVHGTTVSYSAAIVSVVPVGSVTV